MHRHVLLTAVFLGGCAVSTRTAQVQPAPPPPPATAQPAPRHLRSTRRTSTR